MNQKIKLFFNIIIINSAFLSLAFGQYKDIENARIQGKKLEESVLIVRLPVNGPKIRYLRNKIETATNEKAKIKLIEDLEGAERSNKARFDAILQALKNKYTFSRYLILPDSNFNAFTAGDNKVFYNDNGRIDEKIRWDSKDYFLLISGENEDQWVIVNSELRKIDKPFPYRATIFLSGLTRVFSRKKYYEKQIHWLNKKLMVI